MYLLECIFMSLFYFPYSFFKFQHDFCIQCFFYIFIVCPLKVVFCIFDFCHFPYVTSLFMSVCLCLITLSPTLRFLLAIRSCLVGWVKNAHVFVTLWLQVMAWTARRSKGRWMLSQHYGWLKNQKPRWLPSGASDHLLLDKARSH